MAAFNPRTHYLSEQVAENYDAERFQSLSGKIFNWAEKRALTLALRRLDRNNLILDVPCGTGRITELIFKQGHRVVGADLSWPMVSVARRRLAGLNGTISYHIADSTQLGFQDGIFDCVISIRFLAHFDPENRSSFLREFQRVTKKFVIVSYAHSTFWLRLRRRVKYLFHHGTPVRYTITEPRLLEEIQKAGLKEVARFWTARYLSEEMILLLEKIQ